ncbi:Peptidoglycan/LPS O-acetylase OafA/YrhL, contains acyltransferase and SGNH-hydrolase domains [Sphingomonas sp. YR710]|uniref:acyltransferase family protein n=1 Tax=Sphingomonas sp. YR710 TaxID=1882773 RepID=UPI000888A034|nr:acyltransferase [Sphingomonas sp. YR710]SDC61643.1 Peptidoglycan/LPS O-acetylase OafA/YrhL, contains acyltransferase and SGNH-hydrolase domains [Sphingomonas sp. YR710]
MQIGTELRALTSIRGIAAWYVVLYHIRLSAAPSLPPALVGFLARGYLAVDFFFILSGFVIWLNYAGQLREQGISGVPRFLWRRLARIYPLHLFMLLWAVGFLLLCWGLGKAGPDDYPVGELPLHLLLAQNWGFTSALSWNHPAWSISCEWAAYLFFPIIVVAVRWEKWPAIALVTALCVLLASMYALSMAFGLTSLGADIPHFGLPRCILEFSAGTILSALWLRWRSNERLPALICVLIAAGGLILYLTAGAEPLSIFMAFAALTLFLALSSGWRRNPLNGDLIHWLGTVSYATYLVHSILFKMFKLLFVDNPDDIALPLLAVYLALTLFMSFALYNIIERPAQRWMNRRVSAGRGN